MRSRALILSISVMLPSVGAKLIGPTNLDGTVRLTYHAVKTAEDLEIASRYASNYYSGPSTPGVGSLAKWQDSKDYGGLEAGAYPSVLRLPFKRFERPVDVAFSSGAQGRSRQLWADYNFNKTFSADEELKPVTFGKRTVFGPLRTRGREGDPVCYVEDGINILFIPTGWRQGQYVAGGIKNVIAAFDTDHDGEFKGGDDFFGQEDHLIVGQYKDDIDFRRYKSAWPGSTSHMRQLLDGSFCNVSVSKDGTSAVIKSVKSSGTLELSAVSAEIASHSWAPQYFKTSGRTLNLPPGKYRWTEIRAILQDPKGLRWQIEYFNGVGAQFNIQSGSTTRIELGKPAIVDSSVGPNGIGVNYHAFLADKIGNSITDVIGPNGKVVVPKLVVTDKRGKVLESPDWIDTTTISYLGGDYRRSDRPLTFTITWDFGAFGKVSSVNVLK